MSGEWVEWHAGYGSDPGRVARLEEVRRLVRLACEEAPPGAIRLLSLCAGDGRDVLGALEGHPRADDVRAWLVELDPDLVAVGRERARRLGLPGVTFVQGDASAPATFEGCLPVDLVLVCGIFGNISDEDVHRTIGSLPAFLRPGGIVLWTRGRFLPDLTPAIRAWFSDAGFRETAFVPIPQSTATVGAERWEGGAQESRRVDRLFTFLPAEHRPSAGSRRAQGRDATDA